MRKPIPMGRENVDDDFVTGYMDLVDFECELGMASGGNAVYASIEDLRKQHPCVKQCGIVKVKVEAIEVIQETDYSDMDDTEIELGYTQEDEDWLFDINGEG